MLITVKSFLLFCTLITFGYNAASTNASQQISECTAKGGECDESKNRPVCGSDGQTYSSRCHLIRAQCNGNQVTLKHRGRCKDACVASRSYALSQKPRIKFVPRCREDGTYAPIQCLDNNGCWCVNSQGKLIQKTYTKHGRPNCTGKGNQKRSSPMNNQAPRKKCSPNDRVAFNTALTNIFHTEYTKSKSGTIIGDHSVIEWKFKMLDINKNNILEKNEYQGLKKIAKTVVRPKRCGHRFGKYCDTNKDLSISREEFHHCLSKEQQRHLASARGGLANGLNTDDLDDDEDYNEEESDELMTMSNMGNRFSGLPIRTTDDSRYQSVLWRQHGKTTLNLQNESDSRDPDDEINDCIKDRKNALEDKSDTLFLPECTPDGRYMRVQCYRSTGYCWCVNEDTGKPIPGTSLKDKRPTCDSHVAARAMPGCPQKNEFLKDLKEFFKTQITSSSNLGADNTKWGTEDEKIATLSFVLLDKNKNSVWERKEWKLFRELVTATKKLRRCGKKMPRYCDVNNDKKITLSEWLNCLQIQRIQNEQSKPPENEPKPTTQSKLKGMKNPLEFILKAD
ncbi:hypothetical protein PVAND_007556 [Polypedilum vanderplanki]|uniref:SPARC-related modular calcium-binding protein 2 n=1 Tax=Polypedilum vanderplanki TaxID=319348 RepID=A0A9J6C6X3_POLVA|nr:hypothetical protein PVAND_007556 [Polypedilum vanderplanki]